MARRMDGDFGEGTVLDALDDGVYLIMMNDEEVAAKLAASELMPFGSGMGLSTERRQRASSCSPAVRCAGSTSARTRSARGRATSSRAAARPRTV